MEMSPIIAIVPIIIGIVLFLIAVLITRWAFRIDTIVNNQHEQIRLTKILIEKIEKDKKEMSA
jgi:hypothetical protein